MSQLKLWVHLTGIPGWSADRTNADLTARIHRDLEVITNQYVYSVLHKPCCGDKVALTVDVWLCPLCWSDGVQGVAGDASHVSTVQQFVPVKVIASTRLSDVLRLSGGILKCCLLCFMYQRRIKTERGRLSTHPTPVRTVSGKDNIRGRMRSFLHVKCVFLFTVVHHQEEINFFHPQSLKDSTVYNTHTQCLS